MFWADSPLDGSENTFGVRRRQVNIEGHDHTAMAIEYVYRPFSRDAGVLTLDDLPAQSAVRLAKAWERDYDLPGYADGLAATRGGRLRSEITNACRRTQSLKQL